jgi:NAD(P)-dependent dehydrogenase (short-subunit alcohol dehydrogenase family)
MGKAIVSLLLDGGAKVITSAREMTSDRENREHIFVQADLSTSEGCTKVINEVFSRFGGVDVLVNVVGGSSAPSGGFRCASTRKLEFYRISI